jgi:hypothetical protein
MPTRYVQVALTPAQVRELLAAIEGNREHYQDCVDCNITHAKRRLNTVNAAKRRLVYALAAHRVEQS